MPVSKRLVNYAHENEVKLSRGRPNKMKSVCADGQEHQRVGARRPKKGLEKANFGPDQDVGSNATRFSLLL